MVKLRQLAASRYQLYVLSDGTEDHDTETRDVVLGKALARQASVIDTTGPRALLEAG